MSGSFIVGGPVPHAVIFGTFAEISASTPTTEYALAYASDRGAMHFVRGFGWSIGAPVVGSPSNPFPTGDARNAAAPFPAGSRPEVVGSPVNTVYQLKSTATQAGAIDADWQVFGAGGGVKAPPLNSLGFAASSVGGAPGIVYTGQYTFRQQIPALGVFTAIKVRFRNYSASAMDLSLFKVVSPPTSNHVGTGLTWITGTVGGSNSGTVPAANATDQPGILDSDWIPLPSTTRTDIVGAPPVVQAAILYAAGGKVMNIANCTALSASAGMTVSCLPISGDHVTTIDAQNLGNNNFFACDIIFAYANPTITLLDVGDSRAAGIGSNSGCFGGSTAAQYLSRTKSTFVGAANFGVGGTTKANSHTQLLALAPVIRPAYATVWFESPNSGGTQAVFNAGYALALSEIEFLVQYNIIPILVVPTPRNYTAANLVLWQQACARVRTLAVATGYPILDTGYAEDPAVPGAWLAAYKMAADGTNFHGNELFYSTAGQLLLTAMGIS